MYTLCSAKRGRIRNSDTPYFDIPGARQWTAAQTTTQRPIGWALLSQYSHVCMTFDLFKGEHVSLVAGDDQVGLYGDRGFVSVQKLVQTGSGDHIGDLGYLCRGRHEFDVAPQPRLIQPVRRGAVFSDMTVQVFTREEHLELLVSERTRALQTTNRRLQRAHEAIEQDLAMAKVVQSALVREGQVQFGDFEAYARMTPAQQVGGDFVDMLKPAAGTLFVTVGDVSGKGVPAALFMAASQGAITSVASGTGKIAAIASEVNRRLCHENPMGLFVTCVLAMVDLEEGVIEYVCAGHEPAVIVQADGSRRVLPMTGGLAMGILDDFEYDMRREALHAKETLFLYTDGLTDG